MFLQLLELCPEEKRKRRKNVWVIRGSRRMIIKPYDADRTGTIRSTESASHLDNPVPEGVASAGTTGITETTTTAPAPSITVPKPPKKRAFDASRYTTRLIALKFAYLGGNYNGFEHQANNQTPLPTVEEKLFEALLKSRLVAPVDEDGDFEKGPLVRFWPADEVTQYSKGGRTDRGVSAFGQVVGVRVRSNRPVLPLGKNSRVGTPVQAEEGGVVEKEKLPPVSEAGAAADVGFLDDFDPIKDELPYVQILNRLLPHDIRILAWAPNPPPDFSARFNCRGRHYKYFFSNPAIPPRSTSITFSGHLDISKMHEAASYFIGEHDFRNFCKLDASKQITNFKRIIYESSIEELPSTSSTDPKTYYFNLKGSAFLWHQVRHMIAILFLIGQGLEQPSLIKHLLDTSANPRKPQYEMADDRALVLWECFFPEELKWVSGEPGEGKEKGKDGLMDIVWMGWHHSRIEQVLRGGLVGVVEEIRQKAAGSSSTTPIITQEKPIPPQQINNPISQQQPQLLKSHILVDGGSRVLYRGKYIPILSRPRMDLVEELNEKYRMKKPERVSGKGKARRAAEAMEVD